MREEREGGKDGSGYYCGAVGQSAPTDVCEAGFYCRQYANTSTPKMGYDANICPPGGAKTLPQLGLTWTDPNQDRIGGQ